VDFVVAGAFENAAARRISLRVDTMHRPDVACLVHAGPSPRSALP